MALLDRGDFPALSTFGLTDQLVGFEASDILRVGTFDQLLSDLGLFRTLGASAATGMSNTGNTVETTVATVTIPAGAMGANGILRITSLWSFSPNNGNTKTPRVRLNGLAGTIYLGTATASVVSAHFPTIIRNRNATNSQIGYVANTPTQFGTNNAALVTSAIDTTASVDIVFTGQLATGTDTITLESYLVEILKKA